jgi:hypothetical protein
MKTKEKSGLVLVRPLPKKKKTCEVVKFNEKGQQPTTTKKSKIDDLKLEDYKSFPECLKALYPEHKFSYRNGEDGNYYTIIVDGEESDITLFGFEFMPSELTPEVDQSNWRDYLFQINCFIVDLYLMGEKTDLNEEDVYFDDPMIDPIAFFDV